MTHGNQNEEIPNSNRPVSYGHDGNQMFFKEMNNEHTMLQSRPHLRKTLESWNSLQKRQFSRIFEIDGENLSVADVVATAWYVY